MKFIDNKNITDPAINLALEEYAFRNLDIADQWFMFYINEPSVIIGKNQNVFEEVNTTFTDKKDILVRRRMSGGGAVYHDEGNLNFCYIRKYEKEYFNKYHTFLTPFIEVLNEMDVPAEINERNDIVCKKKKISGNAQFTSRDRMMTHGTLLFDSNIYNLITSLKVKGKVLDSKSTKSVRSKVANIIDFMEDEIELEDFRGLLTEKLFGRNEVEVFQFSDIQWEEIYELADTKYRTWEWNYGRSPKFRISRKHELNKENIEFDIFIEKGIIQQFKCKNPNNEFLSSIGKELEGIKFIKNEIDTVLRKFESQNNSVGLADALLKVIY